MLRARFEGEEDLEIIDGIAGAAAALAGRPEGAAAGEIVVELIRNRRGKARRHGLSAVGPGGMGAETLLDALWTAVSDGRESEEIRGEALSLWEDAVPTGRIPAALRALGALSPGALPADLREAVESAEENLRDRLPDEPGTRPDR